MRFGLITVGALAVAGLAVAPVVLLARRLHRRGFDPRNDAAPEPLDLQVTAVSAETVTLRRAAKAPATLPDAAGEYLLQGARGSGYVGRVIESNGIIAIREFRPGEGELRAGDYARLDGYAFPFDPWRAHGIAFETVECSSPLGAFPAWYIRNRSTTWAIMTHGKGADRREALRLIPLLMEQGFNCLAITYRNDVDVPPSPNGMYTYGRDEWEELDAAVKYALARGAADVLLVGYSMGGAITLSFMANSELRSRVSGLILDAPMTNLKRTVAFGATLAGLPLGLLRLSNRYSAWRYGYRWSDFDYFPVLERLGLPVLLFHGDSDRTIPVDLSDDVAALRPDIVSYRRVSGAGHVRAWNVDPAAYRAAVAEFLSSLRSVPKS